VRGIEKKTQSVSCDADVRGCVDCSWVRASSVKGRPSVAVTCWRLNGDARRDKKTDFYYEVCKSDMAPSELTSPPLSFPVQTFSEIMFAYT
jgi:hypothetical protein